MHQNGGVSLDTFYSHPVEYVPIERCSFVELPCFDKAGRNISFVRDLEVVNSDNRKLVTGDLTYTLSGRYNNGLVVHDDENLAVSRTLE